MKARQARAKQIRHFAGKREGSASGSSDDTSSGEQSQDEHSDNEEKKEVYVQEAPPPPPPQSEPIKQEVKEPVKPEPQSEPEPKSDQKMDVPAPKVRGEFHKVAQPDQITMPQDGQDSGSESDSESEGDSDSESESEEEEKPRARPVFVKKNKEPSREEPAEDEKKQRRHEESLRMIEKDVRNAQQEEEAKFVVWNETELDKVDDTDNVDPDAEYKRWKVRELKRIQRERQALQEREQEQQERERRAQLTDEQLAKEDADLLEAQREAKQNRPRMAYMQKYYHKGAFYQGQVGEELENRNYMGQVEDDYADKSVLPQALQVRGGLGLKGRTKHRSLADDDTTLPNKKQKKR